MCVLIVGVAVFVIGVFYLILLGHGVDSLDGVTILAIGSILIIIGVILSYMKKVNPIKQAYDELGNAEKDSKD